MSDRERTADSLNERIRGCTRCPLSETRTHAVPGEGALHAEIMFIGEAPGMNEDRQGRPFVGAAGQFLNEMLAAAGFDREQVFICNILKCRPPENRDPQPVEIEACADYLQEQIDLIDPLVIVSLGRFSLARYFPQAKISRVHGQSREIGDRMFVPMYHPAAALHQQSLRETIREDFRALPEILEQARTLRGVDKAPPGTVPQEPAARQISLFD